MSMDQTYQEFERQILGMALQGEDLTRFVSLPPDAWGIQTHKHIHDAICTVFLSGGRVNEVEVLKTLGGSGVRDVGIEDLMSLTRHWVPTGQLPVLCDQLAEQANHRRVISAVHSAVNLAQGAGSAVEAKQCAIGRILSLEEVKTEDRVFKISQSLDELRKLSLDAFNRTDEEKRRPQGITSGLRALDMVLGGFLHGATYILGAATGRGKSVLGLQWAMAAATDRKRVLYVSLEMSHVDLVRRAVSAKSGVNPSDIQSGTLSSADLELMTDAFAQLLRLNEYLTIYDQPALSLYQLAATVRQMAQGDGIDMMIVDYLQLLRTDQTYSREREVATVSAGLVAIARTNNIPVIAISQLNEDGRIRESRAVEHDASAVMKIDYSEGAWKEGSGPIECDLAVIKHRHGRTGRVPLTFERSKQRFEERLYGSF